ncbi:Uncharacterized protein Adt_44302 [Abeliophyllum distichum]|uniref:Uncharacterized protein n=1 Tax=Abeliophyllum distichum TaxID=126358 RepID=A0ABD1PB19_9LAMI
MMASKVPAQSQTPHNFDLPPLKWSKENQSSSRRRRRSLSIKSPSQKLSSGSPPVESLRLSPLSSSASAQQMSVSRSHSGKSESESKKKPKGAEGNAAGIKGNGSKILIKLPCKNERKNQEEPAGERGLEKITGRRMGQMEVVVKRRRRGS